METSNIDVKITLDDEAMATIRKEVKKQIEEYVRQELILCDIDELARLTSMSKSYLDDCLLHDPRVRQYQRRRGHKGKRFCIYKPTIEAIEYIVTHEWEI